MSRTVEGSGRPSSGSGRLCDRRSICPDVCQQPSPGKMGEQREGAVLGPQRKFRVPGTPPRPLTLSVSPPSPRRRPRDPGHALGTAASPSLPVRLCVCVCLAVPTPELSLRDAHSPRLPSPSHGRLLAPQRLCPCAPAPLPGDSWVSGARTASWTSAGPSACPGARPRARLRSLPLARPRGPGVSCSLLASARGAFWPRIPSAD